MFRRYCAERIPLRLFLPLAALLALAARVDAARSIPESIVDAGILLLLMAQFRLWDDIADRPHDRIAHPERVLVGAPSDTPFRIACGVLAILNASRITAPQRSPCWRRSTPGWLSGISAAGRARPWATTFSF